MAILLPILCACLGIAVGFMIASRKQTHLQASLSDMQAQLGSKNTEVELLQHSITQQKEEAAKALADYKGEVLKRHNDVLDATRQSYDTLLKEQELRHREATAALEKRFDDTVRMVREQMENATGEMLKKRQEEFTTTSSQGIATILTPLKETMEKMKEEMAKNSTAQTSLSTQIKTNLENMIRQSEAAQKSAEELTRAFKHETKTQGNWGEVVLSNLLAAQGLTEGKDFETQATLRDADGHPLLSSDGNRMIPDVLLHLDEHRDVIIDSKVSMTAYIDYANTDDDTLRRNYLKEHVASLKRHVDELSAKNYTLYQSNPHLDFVIMFVPQAPALWIATAEEPSLWQDAMQKKVFIADEHTLYAALRIIRITWTHIDQERNHQRLYELAQEMIERTGRFLKEYDSVGKNLQDAVDAFDASKKKLMTGGMSISTTASKILSLGLSNIKASKSRKGVDSIIPSEYLDTQTQDSPSEAPELPLD